MMQLVASEKEPIAPFVRIIRSLYDDCGISTILVVGGVGDYFDVAKNVVVMDCYKCLDVTEQAKQIVANSKASSSIPHRRKIAWADR
jgi:predicted ABC-class ATPase